MTDVPNGKLLSRWRLMLAITADTTLVGSDLKVAMRILDHHNAATGASWPSIGLMAAQTGLDVRTIIRAITRLVKAGYFKAERKRGRGVVNVYRAVFERSEITPDAPVEDSAENVTATPPFTEGIAENVTPTPPFEPSVKCDNPVPKTWSSCPENVAQLSREPTYEPAQEPVVRLEGNSVLELGLSRAGPIQRDYLLPRTGTDG